MSICPTGWRIPVGNNSGDLTNEWAVLNGSFNTGSLSAPNTTTSIAFAAPWQPAGTSATLSTWNAGFGAVSAGLLSSAGSGLDNQSAQAYWWASSLNSGTNAFNTSVASTGVWPGTNSLNKSNGFSVRCVFP